ncbi:hypothetical protein JK359_32995 [Streptomyces actinomycinicus]|uniref:Uncharacterized protein n=1 Tax=Streptomyces actinomycinicus TaxID=1695166 RepID=A0A937JPE3_9ACTN|nr:hypothetical protein [Streptomyces actinomycinicus]MBL1086724.1 hypothetical protein [Streptomyces actinomycinicus]
MKSSSEYPCAMGVSVGTAPCTATSKMKELRVTLFRLAWTKYTDLIGDGAGLKDTKFSDIQRFGDFRVLDGHVRGGRDGLLFCLQFGLRG